MLSRSTKPAALSTAIFYRKDAAGMNGEPLGPASTTFNDWTGTVALDKPDRNRDHIYEIAGIDRDQWVIVAIELGGAYEAEKMRELAHRESAKTGPVPVARRSIPRHASRDDIAFRLLTEFKGWGIIFRFKTLVQQNLDVVVERDLDLEEPAQGPTDPRG